MHRSKINPTPGRWLHEAIVGAFNARGVGFNKWCEENGISPAMARASTYGQAGGPIGRKRLKKIIDAAGREVIEITYRRRVTEEAARLTAETSPAKVA